MSRTTATRFFTFGLMLFLTLGIGLTGCKKNSDPVSNSTSLVDPIEDAAESVNGAISDDNGGSMDNIGDIATLANTGSLASLGMAKTDDITTMDSTYDAGTGWWTVHISRERGIAAGYYYANFSRTFRFQFLKSGVAQKYRVVGTDTANALKFKIVSGAGIFKTPRCYNTVSRLTASWTVSMLAKDSMSIVSDSTYVREGFDSLTTRNAIRTLNHTLTMNFNVTSPKVRPSAFVRATLHKATAGTITGHYHADVTWKKGDSYSDKTIDKDFSITLQDGDGKIGIGGRSFHFDLKSGDWRP